MISAGRVLIIPKGAWNDTDTYSMLDLVSYNGSSYIAKTSVPANTLPTNTSYWQLSAYGGSAANLAGNFAPLETTDYASQGYAVGDFLVNKDNQFCKVTSIITIGDELILKPSTNYNIEADNVGEEINAIKNDLKDLDDNVDSIYEVMGQNGAKNRLINNLVSGSVKDATLTVNNDKTFSFVGTTSGSGSLNICGENNWTKDVLGLPKGEYVLASDSTGLNSNTFLQVIGKDGNGNVTINAIVNSDGKKYTSFTVNEGDFVYWVRLAFPSGAVNVSAKAMICPKSWYDIDPTYQPYAMTNRELTEEVATSTSTFTTGTNMTDGTKNLSKWGRLVTFGWNTMTNSTGVAAGEVIANIPDGYRPSIAINFVAIDGSSNAALQMTITTDGRVKADFAIPANHYVAFCCSYLL